MSAALVLASTSLTRRRILADAGVPHEAISAGVDEAAAKAGMRAEGLRARAMADALAELKARAGWARRQALVLGCDQTLECDGETFDKAEDMAALRAQLLTLSGRTHKLHSAAVLVENGAATWRHVSTATLTMRRFTEAFLDDYLAAEGEALLSGVGGYRMEGRGVQLFERIDGDHFTILGLPLLPLLEALRLRGVLAA